MKRFILFVILISSMGFMSDAKTDETTQQERIVVLNVSEDCKLEIDSLYRDIATITEHKGEYYVYTANKVNVNPPNATKFANKHLVIEEPGKGGLFFKRSKPSEVASGSRFSFNNNYIIGYDTGSFSRAKFSVAGKVFYLCRPEYHRIDSSKLLIDTVGFHQNKVKVINDTLLFSTTDTLHSISIIEPKHAVFMSCAYNGIELFPGNQSFPVKDFNDLELEDKYSLAIPSNVWEQFSTGGNLYVRMAVLDETGAFDTEYVQTFHIKVEEQNPPILMFILIAAACLFVLLIIVFGIVIFKNRRDKAVNEENAPQTPAPEVTEGDSAEVANVAELEATETSEVPTNADVSAKKDLEDQLKQKDITISDYLAEIELLKKKVDEFEASKVEKDSRIMELEGTVNGQSDKIKELTTKCNDYEKMMKDQDETIVSLEKEHEQEVIALKRHHESECAGFQTEVNDLQSKLVALTSSWAEDKKGIVNFFTRYVEILDQAVNVVLNDADPDSQAYMEISQMADSMNGYLVFKNKAIEILEETTRPISEVEKSLRELLITDMNYEKSWVNAIARLYAYSQVPELETIFGYYDSNAADIKRLFRSLENLSELFGVSDLQVPVLFRDEFTSKKFEYKNTNLVIPQMYPEYVELLKPMVVYDFSRVGYNYVGEIVKPIVAYNTNN